MSEDIEELEVPEGAQYGDNPITEVYLNKDLQRLLINYESKRYGFEQISVSLEWTGTEWEMSQIPVGLVPPKESRNIDSPGANESEKMYKMMEREWNIRVFGKQ